MDPTCDGAAEHGGSRRPPPPPPPPPPTAPGRPTDGSTVDKSKVNVRIETPSGNTELKKRSDSTDTCAADDCWDYDAAGKVELIGRSCTTAKALTDGKVNIVVGCKTVVK